MQETCHRITIVGRGTDATYTVLNSLSSSQKPVSGTYGNLLARQDVFIAISCPLRSWIAPARQQSHAFS